MMTALPFENGLGQCAALQTRPSEGEAQDLIDEHLANYGFAYAAVWCVGLRLFRCHIGAPRLGRLLFADYGSPEQRNMGWTADLRLRLRLSESEMAP